MEIGPDVQAGGQLLQKRRVSSHVLQVQVQAGANVFPAAEREHRRQTERHHRDASESPTLTSPPPAPSADRTPRVPSPHGPPERCFQVNHLYDAFTVTCKHVTHQSSRGALAALVQPQSRQHGGQVRAPDPGDEQRLRAHLRDTDTR